MTGGMSHTDSDPSRCLTIQDTHKRHSMAGIRAYSCSGAAVEPKTLDGTPNPIIGNIIVKSMVKGEFRPRIKACSPQPVSQRQAPCMMHVCMHAPGLRTDSQPYYDLSGKVR